MISLRRQVKGLNILLLVGVFIIFVWYPLPVQGYPIEGFSSAGQDSANSLSRSINETVKSLLQIDLFNFKSSVAGSGQAAGSPESNLISWESFSQQDGRGMLKAVVVLFLQIVITAVGVLLGILKVILEVLVDW